MKVKIMGQNFDVSVGLYKEGRDHIWGVSTYVRTSQGKIDQMMVESTGDNLGTILGALMFQVCDKLESGEITGPHIFPNLRD